MPTSAPSQQPPARWIPRFAHQVLDEFVPKRVQQTQRDGLLQRLQPSLELPRPELRDDVVALLEVMTAWDPNDRPTMQQVRDRAARLVEEIPGPTPRAWLQTAAREAQARRVPPAEPDAWVGRTLAPIAAEGATEVTTFREPEVERAPARLSGWATWAAGLLPVAPWVSSSLTGRWTSDVTLPRRPHESPRAWRRSTPRQAPAARARLRCGPRHRRVTSASEATRMYIRSLKIKNVKLLRDLSLDFTRGRESRMWTVLLGENGTCKTTILQAIAMATSGPTLARDLANRGRGDLLRGLRGQAFREDARILAELTFPDGGHTGFPSGSGPPWVRRYPGLPGERPERPPILHSQLVQNHGTNGLQGISWYKGHGPRKTREAHGDPLELVRASEPIEPHWFVAGYGVDRNLPPPHGGVVGRTVQERLQSLFGGQAISATRWADHFQLSGNERLAEAFRSTLNQLVETATDLLPNLQTFELAADDARSRRDPIERHRVREIVGSTVLDLPTMWLSQGYQSSIAWISDLIGQILVEAQWPVPPADMEGLVLIDEIDLHLHPVWQVGIIQALRQIFPALQFVATTHSPLVITGCEPDEVIRLARRDGQVEVVDRPAPPPMGLTGTELYWNYFEIDRLIPNPIGQHRYDYRALARNGARSQEDEVRLAELGRMLDRLGMRPDVEVVPAWKGR